MGKILLLHGMPPKNFRFKGVEEIELLFKRFYNGEKIVIHNFFVNPPTYLTEYDFDAIFLTSTFLEKLANPKTYKRFKKKYSFLEKRNSITIGLPQDDYWAQEIRDKWYSNNLDVIISVFDKKHWPILYPKSIKKRVKIIRGHTTYINKDSFKLLSVPKYEDRELDVVYRTVGTPYFPNNIGLVKSKIGGKFFKKLNHRLKLDISNKPKDLIFGEKWLEFLANSKGVLGSNSGSSIIIRDHKHIAKVNEAKRDLNFDIDGFENNFFEKKDRNYDFTDISPRNIEAAKTMTLQILVEGDYGGILRKNIDYFCLKEDLSNTNELLDLLKKPEEIKKITQRCFNTIKHAVSLSDENLFNLIDKEIHFFLKNHPKSAKAYKTNSFKEYFNNKIFSIKYNFKHLIKSILNEYIRG